MIPSRKSTIRSEVLRGDRRPVGVARRIQLGLVALFTITATLGALAGSASAATPPSITSAGSANFGVGANGSFSVVATGTPAPTFSETGSLPSGVTLSTGGTLSGTPAAGTSGVYPITITAANGTLPNATQSFDLNVWTSAPTCGSWDSIAAPSGAKTATIATFGGGGGGGGLGGSGTAGTGGAGAQVSATYTIASGQTLWADIGCGGGGGADGTGTGHTALSGGGTGERGRSGAVQEEAGTRMQRTSSPGPEAAVVPRLKCARARWRTAAAATPPSPLPAAAVVVVAPPARRMPESAVQRGRRRRSPPVERRVNLEQRVEMRTAATGPRVGAVAARRWVARARQGRTTPRQAMAVLAEVRRLGPGSGRTAGQ